MSELEKVAQSKTNAVHKHRIEKLEGAIGTCSGSTYKPTFWNKYQHIFHRVEYAARPIIYILAIVALIKYIV